VLRALSRPSYHSGPPKITDPVFGVSRE